MLQNASLLAKIGADTAENERYFAKKLATTRPLRSVREALPDALPPVDGELPRAGWFAALSGGSLQRRVHRPKRCTDGFFIFCEMLENSRGTFHEN